MRPPDDVAYGGRDPDPPDPWSTVRRLVYYVATSLDGYIAQDDGGFAAFPNDPATLTALFAEYPETCPAHVRGALGSTRRRATSTPSSWAGPPTSRRSTPA
ncbi:hypothetical protein [Phycicoccus sp. HDW14]|uniref:hypothetical protein n=1 Tax=Phycicoccus sp. HDW14 TaxID=2714941 RepID=UPI001F0F2BB5|nr:hypothetical protein [Phycicoccus sp. HDW14]